MHYTIVLCAKQNLTWLVDLLIIPVASVLLGLVSDTTFLTSVVHWSHHPTQYAYASECAWFNFKKQGKWACLFEESVFVSLYHVTFLLTDMWQQPHANPRPDWNHMIAHTSLVYSWATWLTDSISPLCKSPSKGKPPWMSQYSGFYPSVYMLALLTHCLPLTNSGMITTLVNRKERLWTKVNSQF